MTVADNVTRDKARTVTTKIASIEFTPDGTFLQFRQIGLLCLEISSFGYLFSSFKESERFGWIFESIQDAHTPQIIKYSYNF